MIQLDLDRVTDAFTRSKNTGCASQVFCLKFDGVTTLPSTNCALMVSKTSVPRLVVKCVDYYVNRLYTSTFNVTYRWLDALLSVAHTIFGYQRELHDKIRETIV